MNVEGLGGYVLQKNLKGVKSPYIKKDGSGIGNVQIINKSKLKF